VIAEDSWSRTAIVKMDGGNPNGRQIVDAMWTSAPVTNSAACC
jgi:hypothetical protein